MMISGMGFKELPFFGSLRIYAKDSLRAMYFEDLEDSVEFALFVLTDLDKDSRCVTTPSVGNGPCEAL